MGASVALKLTFLTFLLIVIAPSWVFAQIPKEETKGKRIQSAPVNPPALSVNNQDGPWKAEFERICAQTEIATSLSKEQLEKLVVDASTLLEQLHAVEDPWAKVYIFRLKKCREFFEFALQWQAMETQS